MALVRDISERKQIQARLMIADRMASMGTVAAGVAHEINNPLAYIMANLHFITKELGRVAATSEGLEPAMLGELLEALRDAGTGAQRVREIVRDLKTFSRADEETRGPVDVCRVLDSSLQMAGPEIKHRARVIKEYAEVPEALGNESRLGQVFLNLIVNAAQAIPEGQAEQNRIRVVAREEGGKVVVEVTDTGSGIPPEIQAKLFEPFFTTKPIGVGTGLGLSICQSIVVAHGGTLELSSELGKGTTVRVTLPRVPEAEERAPEPTAPSVSSERRGRILVVDDEPMVSKSIQRALSRRHEVVCEAAAKAALIRLRRGEQFDLVICDLMMPDVTGMELHAELSKTHPALASKMVFITGGAFTERGQAFLTAVPNRRLEKPFELAAIEALVHDALR